MGTPLLIFPFGGNARETVSVLEAINAEHPQWELLGFIDDDAELKGNSFGGYTVLGGRETLRQALEEYPNARVLAVPGSPQSFRRRHQVIAALSIQSERFTTLVHPRATVGNGCRIGSNTVIMAGVVLTANVTIGDHCVILPNSVISHESRIGDHTLVGSNVTVSGSVNIAKNCYIGSGSKLINGIRIGEGALLGLGSVVIRDVEALTVVAGCPARELT